MRTAVEKIAKSENALFSGPPYDAYTVFFNVIREPINFGGGLELRRAVLEAAAEVDRLPDHVEEYRVGVVRRSSEDGVLGLRDPLDVRAHVARDGGRRRILRPHGDADPPAVHLQ